MSDERTFEEEVEGLYPFWPNCSIPDCEFKSVFGLSDMCDFHRRGVQPPTMEAYQNGR